MSSDFSNQKPSSVGQFPDNVQNLDGQGASGFTRVYPWITPEKLRDEYLFGIPLVSPLTQQKMSDETIKSIINRSAGKLETKTKVDIFPTVRVVRLPYDRTKNQQGFGQLNIGIKPIKTLLEVSIRTSATQQTTNSTQMYDNPSKEGSVLYRFPLEWIDQSLMNKGIIAFTPLQSSPMSMFPGGSFGGAAAPLLIALQQLNYYPGFWYVRYESGFDENSIPSVISDLVATYAAMEILSQLGATNKFTSQSISHDGTSQATSSHGPQWFVQRYNDLKEKSVELEDIVKKRFSTSIFMDNI